MTLTPLETAKLKARLTPLEWIRFEMAEDKDEFVAEFCREKLDFDGPDIRRAVKNMIKHLVKLYDTNTIYKGDGFDRYIKMRKANRLALVV